MQVSLVTRALHYGTSHNDVTSDLTRVLRVASWDVSQINVTSDVTVPCEGHDEGMPAPYPSLLLLGVRTSNHRFLLFFSQNHKGAIKTTCVVGSTHLGQQPKR